MRDLNQKYLLGLVDVTPRREYREHILFLEAECDSLMESLKGANEKKAEWFGKYTDAKQAHDALLQSKATISEQLAAERAKVAALGDEIRNLNALIEKIKKEREVALDKAERADAQASHLQLELSAAVRDAQSQSKAYMELAHDYELLKDDYDTLRTSIVLAQAEAERRQVPDGGTATECESVVEFEQDGDAIVPDSPNDQAEVIEETGDAKEGTVQILDASELFDFASEPQQASEEEQPEEYTIEAPSSPDEPFKDAEVCASEMPATPDEVFVGNPEADGEAAIESEGEEQFPSATEHSPKKKKNKKRRR